MGIMMNQQDNRTELQKRIAAELSDKAKKKADQPKGEMPDGVDDSAYVEHTKQTTSYAWVWIVLVAVGAVALLWYFVATAGNTF
jgi:cytoskeletal protein RodZ